MNPDNNQPEQKPTKGYGKRPIWQWIVLYLVIGTVVYFLVWLLFLNDSGPSSIY